jgi:hypothetical protein
MIYTNTETIPKLFFSKIKYTKSKIECLYEKIGIFFKQIYKLTKRFLKRLNIKKRKIVKEVDQENTRMNL